MERERKKIYLSRYLSIKAQIYDLKEEQKRWRDFGESITAKLSSETRAGGISDKTQLAAVEMAAIGESIAEKIIKLSRTRDEIENTVEAVNNETWKRLLKLRYIYGLTWDKIGEKMGYSTTHIYRIHEAALSAVVIDEKQGD